MGWLIGIARAKWFLPVLIGSIVGVTAVFGWGYLKGYDKAEDKYLREMNEALEAQMERLTAIHQQDLQNAVRRQGRVSNVRTRIQDVQRADCHITPECLRAFNDGVRATGTNPTGVDETP